MKNITETRLADIKENSSKICCHNGTYFTHTQKTTHYYPQSRAAEHIPEQDEFDMSNKKF